MLSNLIEQYLNTLLEDTPVGGSDEINHNADEIQEPPKKKNILQKYLNHTQKRVVGEILNR